MELENVDDEVQKVVQGIIQVAARRRRIAEADEQFQHSRIKRDPRGRCCLASPPTRLLPGGQVFLEYVLERLLEPGQQVRASLVLRKDAPEAAEPDLFDPLEQVREPVV